jgi:hypothetical protein
VTLQKISTKLKIYLFDFATIISTGNGVSLEHLPDMSKKTLWFTGDNVEVFDYRSSTANDVKDALEGDSDEM